jgi:tyrosine-protein phosphatase YwqE
VPGLGRGRHHRRHRNTPHQLGRYGRPQRAAAVREGVAALNRSLMVEGVPLRVFAGADVRVDERLARLLDEDQCLSLAGGAYVLLELPHDTFIDPAALIAQLVGAAAARSSRTRSGTVT